MATIECAILSYLLRSDQYMHKFLNVDFNAGCIEEPG